MTTGVHGQPPPLAPSQNNQNEINNNSSCLNVENNNGDSFSLSDEENTSEYGQSPPEGKVIDRHLSIASSDSAVTRELKNRLNNNNSTMASSAESDNILNNNDVLGGGISGVGVGTESGLACGQEYARTDSNHNEMMVQEGGQQQQFVQ